MIIILGIISILILFGGGLSFAQTKTYSLEECIDEALIHNAEIKELEAEQRIIKETKNFISLVPFGARLPYEVHIYPKKHVQSLPDLQNDFEELGEVIQDIAQRYDAIFEENAYMMVFHTRPSDREYERWHFHIEFYTPWRDSKRRKFLAGLEAGTWTYTNDSSPEEKAKELREIL